MKHASLLFLQEQTAHTRFKERQPCFNLDNTSLLRHPAWLEEVYMGKRKEVASGRRGKRSLGQKVANSVAKTMMEAPVPSAIDAFGLPTHSDEEESKGS